MASCWKARTRSAPRLRSRQHVPWQCDYGKAAGLGNDSFNVGAPLSNLPGNPGDVGDLDYIAGRLTVVGNGGSDSLEVDDQAVGGAFNYIVTPTSITNDPAPQFTAPLPAPAQPPPLTPPSRTFAGVAYDSTGVAAADTISSLRLDGTDQVNIFNVTPSKITTMTINGNGPASGGPSSQAAATIWK